MSKYIINEVAEGEVEIIDTTYIGTGEVQVMGIANNIESAERIAAFWQERGRV